MGLDITAYSNRIETEFSFRAGSYSGYNHWRNRLSEYTLGVCAETVWLQSKHYNTKPFYELIDFTDCDGVIGSVVAQKLLADFVEFREVVAKAAKNTPDGSYFMKTYDNFTEAFRIAAQEGCVRFH